MSEVKRLNFTVDQFESVVPYASEHGQYVRYADYAKLEAEAQALREEVAALRAKLSDLPEWLRSIYEWGYVGGQNNPNGYIDEKDRDECVNDILLRNHIST